MTDIYLTKTFQAFAARERISDATVINAAREIRHENYEANLGGCVYKNGSRDTAGENAAATAC